MNEFINKTLYDTTANCFGKVRECQFEKWALASCAIKWESPLNDGRTEETLNANEIRMFIETKEFILVEKDTPKNRLAIQIKFGDLKK
jgi:hypothetical protein